ASEGRGNKPRAIRRRQPQFGTRERSVPSCFRAAIATGSFAASGAGSGHTSRGPGPPQLANLWRLTRLYESELRLLPGVSAARWSAVLVTLIACASMAVERLLDGQAGPRIAVGALVWLPWVVGG